MPRKFKVTVNNVDYDVAVLEIGAGSAQVMPAYTPTAAPVAPTSQVPASAAAASSPVPAAAGSGDQCAQMGGVVVNIAVKEGQSVNEGDVVVELEAMKMKVPVVANRAGKVSRILVAVGDGVENGQPLLTIA